MNLDQSRYDNGVKTRTRRFITRVVVFLLLGAIVNVAVAWGRTAFPWQPVDGLTEVAWDANWPTAVPLHWPLKARRLTGTNFAWETVRFTARKFEADDSNDVTKTEAFYIDLHTVGWPAKSMMVEWWDEFVLMGKPLRKTNRFDGHPSTTVRQVGLPIATGYLFLPLQPIWPGFAINTIFYSAILWLLFFAPGSVRRMIRRRRGLCPACAYPVGTSEVCTECGGPVRL
jgi:hypothetical protein